MFFFFFFFKQKTAYELRISDWSSDVCSSDLAYVAAALFLARTLRSDEPRWLPAVTHLLFVAFAVVIGGSMLGEWAGILQMLGNWWFWIGNQGWEYLELGRIWQVLLIVGLRSEEHTSELQSLMRISHAVF